MSKRTARALRHALLPTNVRRPSKRSPRIRLRAADDEPPSLRTLVRTARPEHPSSGEATPLLEVPPRPSDIFEMSSLTRPSSVPPPLPMMADGVEARSAPSEAPVMMDPPVEAEAAASPFRAGAILTSCAFGAGLLLALNQWVVAEQPEGTAMAGMPGPGSQVDVAAFVAATPVSVEAAPSEAPPWEAAPSEAESPEATSQSVASGGSEVALPRPSTGEAGSSEAAAPQTKAEPGSLAPKGGVARSSVIVEPAESDDGPRPFDEKAARAAVAAAAGSAMACGDGTTSGRAQIAVTLAPSGRATQAVLVSAPTFLGTPVGSCIARAMRGVRVPPFAGGPVTVTKTLYIR